MSVPRIYSAISAVQAELSQAGVAKAHVNVRDNYDYRSIDDVVERISPILARNKLCVLPRVLERTVEERLGEQAELLVSVSLHIAFDLVCADDGSMHSIEVFSEALDAGDKATAKAMSSGFKQALLQTFCVPVAGVEEPEKSSYRLKRSTHLPEPPEGWPQWSSDLLEIVRKCETEAALDRTQTTHRQLLKALSTERPDLYRLVGEKFQERRAELALPKATLRGGRSNKAGRLAKRNGSIALQGRPHA